ncbi:MAG TPA: glycosyltransferase family 4 protein [Verrucomicrobiae bacterium]|nr:glycosyltransferase family 4 protein [Verrucomicrobiae bacterium]
MKILMLGWELPPHNSGGLGVACYNMSKALAVQGADIDFVLPYNPVGHDISFMKVHGATPTTPDKITYTTYSHPPFASGAGATIRSIQQQYAAFTETLVRQQRPQVIHAHDWLTMEAAVRAKHIANVPLIAHVHAAEFDRSGEHYGNPFIHEIEQMGLEMADRIIAVSNITKNIIVKHYGIPAEKIAVVYNAADEAQYAEVQDTNTYAYLEAMKREGYRVVVTLGRLTVQKGLTYFLRAAARASEKYDKLLFVVAGDGELRDELLELSASLGIADKVFFTGFVRGKQWRDAYRIADAFVMSSVSEPFGLTALEAAASDTVVVLSRQSGVGEVLHSVLRFNYWETDRLADQLVAVAASPALYFELRKNVAQEYARISWQDVAKQCLGLYKQLAEVRA